MASVNKVITIIGNLGLDLELRYSVDGAAICTIPLPHPQAEKIRRPMKNVKKHHGIGSCSIAVWRKSQRSACAMAAMGQSETKIDDICQKLDITGQTLYWRPSSRGEEHPEGIKLLTER